MRGLRMVLAVAGVVMIVVGAWELRGSDASQLLSLLLWLAGGVLVHDAVIAPVTVLLLALGWRWVPRAAWPAAVVALMVWATVTVATANVLLGVGGKADNPTLLNRPYLEWWLALSVLWWSGAALCGWWLRRRDGS